MANEVDVASVTTDVYNLLKSLDSEDRQRVVNAALTLLGEVGASGMASGRKALPDEDDSEQSFLPKVRVWLKKNALTSEVLSQVFHIESGSAEIIAGSVPGKSGRERTINAYVLTGTREYILSGEAKFDDQAARDVCRSLGCYNETNHSTYVKDRGNVIGGSKNAGWTLTGPGLKAAADLIREISGD